MYFHLLIQLNKVKFCEIQLLIAKYCTLIKRFLILSAALLSLGVFIYVEKAEGAHILTENIFSHTHILTEHRSVV